MTAPALDGEPGWTEVFSPMDAVRSRSFVSGDGAADGRLRIRYFADPDAPRAEQTLGEGDIGALVARVWFGPGAEGPPGHAHGGAQAAVLDEVLGLAGWLAGHPVVMARLEVDMRRMLPLGTVCTVRTEITEVKGRKVRVAGQLVGDDGAVYAEAAGTCVAIGVEQFGIALEG
jgi:acyl-coenzyme A thioesterase PaaI-like protein